MPQQLTLIFLVRVELSIVMKKLKDIVPVLINCFQDFLSLIHSMPTLDAQTFDCMFSILTSTDLAARFFIDQVRKDNTESQHCGGDEVNLWNQMISSVLVKNLLGVFPLNSMQDLSEKVLSLHYILIVFSLISLEVWQ